MRASLSLVLVAALAARVPAHTVHFVPQEHPTIAAAVGVVKDGDTIIVSAGTYAENVVLGAHSDVTLRAKGKAIIAPATGTGLQLNDCGNCAVIGFRFEGVGSGLVLHSCHDVLVSKCRTTGTALGFRIEGGNDNTLSKCRVEGTDGGNGIELGETGGAFTHDDVLSHCTVTDAAADGIVVLGSFNLLDHCKVVTPGQHGIVLDDLANCVSDEVTFCKVIDAQGIGIVAVADTLVLRKCRVISSVMNGILDEGCTFAEFDSCTVIKAGGDGITTNSSSSNGSIHDCKLLHESGDGLFVQGSLMTIVHNKVIQSLSDGIAVHGSNGTYTSNTANGCVNTGIVLLAGDHNTLTSNKAHGSGAFDFDDSVDDPTNLVDDSNKFGTTAP